MHNNQIKPAHKTILSLLFCGFCLSISAQSFSGQHSGFTFGMRVQTMQNDDFSDQVAELGFPRLRNDMSGVYFGYLWVKDRWMNTIGLHYGNQIEQRNDFNKSLYRRVGMECSTAFNVLSNNSSWFAGPEIMIGYQLEEVILSEVENPANVAASLTTEYSNVGFDTVTLSSF